MITRNLALEGTIFGGFDMEQIVRKGMRIRKPVQIRVNLRSSVYDFLCSASDDVHCGVEVLVRGIIEDFYDQHSSEEDPNHD